MKNSWNPYLSICANGSSTVIQQLWHVVVATELPQACLQVKIAVESKGISATHGHAVLVWQSLANNFWVLCGVSDETMCCLDLVEIQEVRAAVVTYSCAIWTKG